MYSGGFLLKLSQYQLSPETSFTKPKPTKPVFRPIRIQNLRFNPIRAFVLFLINGSGDPLSLIFGIKYNRVSVSKMFDIESEGQAAPAQQRSALVPDTICNQAWLVG